MPLYSTQYIMQPTDSDVSQENEGITHYSAMNFSGSEGLLAASWDIRSPIVSFTLFFSENTVQER